MIKTILFLCVCLFNGFSTALYSQKPKANINFEHISVEQGLSQSTVQCILQDRKGFLWFGTEDGLNKYDGYNFKVYRPEPGNPNSLSINLIRTMVEDSDGIFWIGTLGGGLNKFDPVTETFTHFRRDPKNPASLSNDHIFRIISGGSGVLWIGTFGGGLDKFDPKRETFTHYRNNPKNPNSLSNDEVRAIYQDRTGILWIGTARGGLNKFDPVTETFTHYRADPRNPKSLSDNFILSIFGDETGELWIGTYSGGLNKFDPSSGTFTRYPADPQNPKSLSDNTVWAIYRRRGGVLRIGTTGGLNTFDPVTETFVHYRYDPRNPNSLSNNEIRSIFQDRSGVLWIGTAVGGLNKFTREKQRFTHYRTIPNDPYSLDNNKVISIYEDRAGVLWVGTFGGLSKLDRESGKFFHFRNDTVMCIYEDSSEVLWIGTLGGLNIFDREKEKFTRYLISAGDANTLSDRIIAITEDRWGYLWVGTVEGLNRLDPKAKTYTRYKKDVDNPNSLSHSMVMSILEDSSGVLWVGTQEGLNRFDRETESFTHYLADLENPRSLSSDKIIYMYEDRSGTLWLGTFGGLNKYRRESDTFTRYTMEDGLPNNMIYGILEDDDGNLWLSTNKGLSRFNPQAKTFRNYDSRDGVQGDEFKHGACFRGRDGRMFFGGINGFNAFFPGNITDNTHKPEVVITNLQVANQSVPIGKEVEGLVILKKHISETREIELSYKHSGFSFEYVGLHYAAPGKNRYAYKMEKLEEDWNYVGNRRFANYSHLPPGRYVFRVKSSNNDGIWNETGTSVKIRIHPPPWQTWWAYSFYFLALAGVVFGYVRSQRRKLAYVRSVNERLRQVDRLKDEFLANTSHELRTPLNGIIGIAESLMQGATGPLPERTLSNLRMVILSGKRLSNLVNDILDYSKLKEKDLQLHLKAVDMKSLTEVVLLMSRPLIAAKPLQFKNEMGNDIPLVHGDENRLQQIMHNLIGNAVKFTESGFVTVSAEETGDGMVMIRVTDTGIGIPRDKQDEVFKTFEQVDASIAREYSGTGLGLSITKQLVELHSGSMGVESEVGAGSTFWFTLPVWREDLPSPLPAAASLATADTRPYEIVAAGGDTVGGKGEVKSTGETYRILAVDDEIINLQVLVNHLSLHNFSVIKTTNGKDALEIIRDCKAGETVDIVLLDVMMPRMSGYEVCREIRRHYSASELPVIMLTAKTQVSNVLEGLDSGANDYITKPFSSEELLERINVHLQLLKANRDLKGANEKLEDYNRTLEQKVKERTLDLREKNRLIMDSMTIARRIQQSILPLQEKIKAALPEHFILFKSKDIVSGDFYWFEQVEDKIFIAVVDCTGHGVPGALMSMIGDTVLGKLVVEQRIFDPASILEYLHKDVSAVLKQRGDRHVDTAGMDVCLCMIEKEKDGEEKKITFAGAHLPLYIVKNKKEAKAELLEIKGDRKSIGGLRKGIGVDRTFTGNEIFLKKGDMIYLTSDGFAHQNDLRDKKYGRKKLRQLLKAIAPLPMESQENKMVEELENHMGAEEQRDDITVVGIRVE